jgi:hypothetical protein
MDVRRALRDAALVAPLALVLVLSAAYAVKEAPHPYVWVSAAGVIMARGRVTAAAGHQAAGHRVAIGYRRERSTALTSAPC